MAERPTGRLIAYRADRLGARLVSLMNAMRIAGEVGADFRCAWTRTTGVGEVFNDPAELFEPDFIARHFLAPADWRSARPHAVTLRTGGAHSTGSIRATLSEGTDMIVGNAFGVIRLAGESDADVLSRFREQFHRIPFAAPVARSMATASAALQGHTAYHIRRGDLTGDLKAMNKAWPHKMVPNEFYEAHMRERLDAACGVVLFSDDSATIRHFQHAFPALKVTGDVIDVSGLTEAQRDLVELYAMGCCATIIAPERSAFSSTAADLFGAARQPIARALGDRLLNRAHEALLERVEKDPGSFPGDGEIGQCLVHLGDWLGRSGRWQDVARVFSGQVRRGLNISFVYPGTLTALHRSGDLPGVLEISALLPHRHIVHTRDRVDAGILHGWGHIRSGDRALGLRHIANGFWHGPTSGLARSAVPLMVELGWYDHRNFLPVTALQRAIQRRRGPVKTLTADLPGIEQTEGIDLPDSMGRLETMIWDWAPLLRSASTKSAMQSGAIGRVIEVLRKARPNPEQAGEVASQIAFLQALSGKSRSALDQLETLGTECPDDWQVWQRLSHLCWRERAFERASDAASRALDCLGDSPALKAWAGMILVRRRKWDPALTVLREADTADIGFPGITALLAQAQSATDDKETALSTIRRARRFAPQDPRMAIFEARLLEQSGDLVTASRELEVLVDQQRATGKVFVQLVSILRQLGETARAAEVARIAEHRFPDRPKLAVP